LSNWVADFLTRNPEQASWAVEKRAKHSLHLKRPDGVIEANFTGSPMHYEETAGVWKPIDTKLLVASGGFYGIPGSDVKVHPDGRVTVDNSDYQQHIALPNAPVGYVDGDRIVREFTGGRHIMRITETGFREEIILDSLPPLSGAAASKFLTQRTGTLLPKYTYYGTKCIDANGREFVFTGDLTAFRKWMQAAVYPVTIDPDFADSTADGYVRGANADYATARTVANSTASNLTANSMGQIYSTNYYPYRVYLKFDTSAIGAGAVTQVNLKMVATVDGGAADFDVVIKKQDWSGQDPLGLGNMEVAYDGCLAATADDNIWRNTSGMSLNTQYTSGNLSTAWINGAGNTYYSIISSRDVSATSPSGDERISIAAQEHATEAYRPVLTVLYETPLIKTIGGLAIASVKTVNGLAIASVKTANGLAKTA